MRDNRLTMRMCNQRLVDQGAPDERGQADAPSTAWVNR